MIVIVTLCSSPTCAVWQWIIFDRTRPNPTHSK